MAGGDWTSMLGYGGILATPAGTVAAFPLMTMPDVGTYDASLPEGGGMAFSSVGDWSIQRIVGQVFRQRGIGHDGDVTFGWRLMALPWDFTNDNFDVPWNPGDSIMVDPYLSDIVRWWAERFYVDDQTTQLAGLGPLWHPWWTQVDIEPKVLVGMHTSEWPALVIDNTYNEEELWLVHRLRAYGYQR